MLLFLMSDSANNNPAHKAIGSNAYGQNRDEINKNVHPITNAAGNKCTIFKLSGCSWYSETRAIPNTLTCLKKERKLTRRL